MLDLTFGEQVKIILSRRGMTIKELAETIEERTGKKMSRQNLTQRLGRDNSRPSLCTEVLREPGNSIKSSPGISCAYTVIFLVLLLQVEITTLPAMMQE